MSVNLFSPEVTEIDHIPEEIRIMVGDIILISASIQRHLSEIFAKVIGASPAYYSYIGHDLDVSKTITAIKRFAKSPDCSFTVDDEFIKTINKCLKIFEKRNKIAHGAMFFDENMLMRYEIETGVKPQRVFRILGTVYFTKILAEAKSALWAIRLENAKLSRATST